MIHSVKLLPKTLKGGRYLHDINHPTSLTVLKEQNTVGHSDKEGPWIFVSPSDSFYNRWVHLTDDKDFFVEVIR